MKLRNYGLLLAYIIINIIACAVGTTIGLWLYSWIFSENIIIEGLLSFLAVFISAYGLLSGWGMWRAHRANKKNHKPKNIITYGKD